MNMTSDLRLQPHRPEGYVWVNDSFGVITAWVISNDLLKLYIIILVYSGKIFCCVWFSCCCYILVDPCDTLTHPLSAAYIHQ